MFSRTLQLCWTVKLQNCSVDDHTSPDWTAGKVLEEVNTLLQSIWTITGLLPVILDRKENLMAPPPLYYLVYFGACSVDGSTHLKPDPAHVDVQDLI